MVKEIDIHIQEAQGVPNKMDTMTTTLRHVMIKMPQVKDKERILNAQEKSRQLPAEESADFSKETLPVTRDRKKYSK